MALPDDDDDATTGTEGAGAGALGKKGKDAKAKHHENLLYIGIALVGVIITFLIYRSNKAAQQSGTALTSSPPVSGNVAGSGSGGTATDPYAEAGVNALQSQFQQQGQAISGLQSLLTTLQSEVGSMQASPPASSTPAPAAAATPATPGYGYINLPGIGQSVILGQITDASQDFTGYNVGGGAPVYFGNANGAAQGPGGETQGNYAYTPVAYAGLVGSSVSSEHL